MSFRPSTLTRIAVAAAVPLLVSAAALISVLAQSRTRTAPLPTRFVRAWGGFEDPIGIALNRFGMMDVIGLKPNDVEELWVEGRPLASWQTVGPTLIPPPSGIAIDGRNRVYVCYPSGYNTTLYTAWSTVDRVSSEGRLSHPYLGEIDGPCAITFDSHGRLWTAVPAENRVIRFSGGKASVWGNSFSGLLSNPTAVTVDSWGRAFVTEQNKSTVDLLGPPGRVLKRWGKYGSGPLQFNQPAGIAVDAHGRLYVADWGNNRVQILSESGQLLGIVGKAGHGPGEFESPSAVALDRRGNLYVVDTGNNRVEEFAGAG
jgi:DNA-binding beta-propeller fold protein YncE